MGEGVKNLELSTLLVRLNSVALRQALWQFLKRLNTEPQ